MLFVKYVSDFYKEKLEELKAKFGDNEERSIGVQRICDIGLVSSMYTVFKTNDRLINIDYLK